MFLNTIMYRLLTATTIMLIWGACANRVPPTGGPKDETPPALVASIPKDGNTNVKTREITLLFDELVVAKNIKKELLITPRIEFDYEYKVKKNSIILILEEALDSATTYTFNFRNSIVDINESNPVENLVLAFSTGSILDTLELKGNINDLLTEKLSAKLIVGLYKSNDTLNLFNSPPYYLAQTDKEGNYLFRNLKPEEYILNAFADANNNLICETDREAYAFTNSSVKIDSNIVADTLKLHSLNIDTLQLKRTRNSGQYFVAVANKYLINLELKSANDSTLWYSLDKDHKEIKIYNTFPIKDSLMVHLSMTDSLNTTAIDTFYLKFPESTRNYDEYKMDLKELEVYPESKKISFRVTTSKPSNLIYEDSIRIKVDTLPPILFDSTWNISINKNYTEFEFSNFLPKSYLDSISTTNNSDNSNNLTSAHKGAGKMRDKASADNVKAKTVSKINYQLEIPFATFQSIEADSAKHKELKLVPKYNKDFGILMGTITTDYTHYFIQLLTTDFNLVQEITPTSKYKLRHIKPGEYLIRVMIDTNKNGKWDPGNILLNQLPELVLIYKNESGNSKTTIRANWEISLDLIF